ncbi:MAG: glycosyltransferase [Chitinivibrionales bacterium]|nr:glycosyltransferase [Chitinivibrionales bacterium]
MKTPFISYAKIGKAGSFPCRIRTHFNYFKISAANPKIARSKTINRSLLRLSFGALALGLLAFCGISFFPSQRTLLFFGGFSLSFCGMLGLRHTWPLHWKAVPIVVIAVIARCFLLPLEHSDDLNRYLWEGRVQLHAINPYAIAPIDPRTAPLRDATWQGINHKEFTSIYGPLAQLVFRASVSVRYSALLLKIILTLFDLCTLLLLVRFLSNRKSRLNEALLYAVNPVVLYAFAAEGHVESIMLCMLAAAMLMHQKKKFAFMFVLVGCAASVKLTALIFLPLLVRKETLRYLPFVLLPLVMVVPYGASIGSLITVTGRFASEFHFNGFIYGILASFFSQHDALLVLAIIFLAFYGAIIFVTPDPIRACGNVALVFLLTSPTAQPWYFAIMAMFAVLYPVRSWIALSGTVGISWLTIFKYWAGGIWQEFMVVPILEYMPPLLLEIGSRWRWPGFASPGYGSPQSLAIIIPVLNEGKHLRDCLESIALPQDVAAEIIVVDGGSTDDTALIAQSDPRVKLVISGRGRGIQIDEGVKNSTGDLVIILHADTRLVQDAVKKIYGFCKARPRICGGCVAAKFNAPGIRFTLITVLNNLRARLTGISFGDQVQFFRREAIQGAMPRVKLMEDIEISLLLKERGELAVLPALARSSARRWRQKPYLYNTLLVLWLTAAYLVRRRLGTLMGDNADFYKAYYGKA